MSAKPLSAALISVVVLGLAGCGGGGEKRADQGSEVTTLPGCAPKSQAVALPDGFPDGFPLPRAAVVRTAKDDGKTMNVVALVPGDIRDVTESLLDELESAGYKLGEGDSEEHEAESHFDGNGFAGFFKLNTVGGCAGANTLALVLSRS